MKWLWFSVICIGYGCGHGQSQDPPHSGDEALSADDAAPTGPDSAPTEDAERVPPIVIPDDLPWTDPRAMAIETLNRCKASDVTAVLAVSTKVNRGHRIQAFEGRSACESIFGPESWRTKAVQTWTGDVKAVRVHHEDAWALFHDLGDGDSAVVILKLEGDRWRFHDLFNTPTKRFEMWGSSR